MWPFKVLDNTCASDDAESQQIAVVRARRADLSERAGVPKQYVEYLHGKEPIGQTPRSIRELYAMIDALEKRVRELEGKHNG